jgi:hypothetical protein
MEKPRLIEHSIRHCHRIFGNSIPPMPLNKEFNAFHVIHVPSRRAPRAGRLSVGRENEVGTVFHLDQAMKVVVAGGTILGLSWTMNAYCLSDFSRMQGYKWPAGMRAFLGSFR